MRVETVLSPPIRGAARSIDRVYPSPQPQTETNNLPGLQWMDRQGIGTALIGTTTGGGDITSAQWMLYRGRCAFRFSGVGPFVYFYKVDNQQVIFFPQDAGSGEFDDDFRNWRVAAIMAFDPVLGSDVGLEIAAGGNHDIILGATPGFWIGPVDGTHLGLKVRQIGGGPFTISQPLPVVVDIQDWNMIDVRFSGATSRGDAAFQVLINGTIAAGFLWGPGTLLPNLGNGTQIGYVTSVGSRGATSYLSACGLVMQASPTVSGLL